MDNFAFGAEATAIRPGEVEYKRDDKTETLHANTIIWTTGTNTYPLIEDLPIPKDKRDKHGRPFVTPTLQLLDFSEVFAGVIVQRFRITLCRLQHR